MFLNRVAITTGIVFLVGLFQSALDIVAKPESKLDTHAWPILVDWKEDENTLDSKSLGPFFEQGTTLSESYTALRPFYLSRTYLDDSTQNYSRSVLYPLFIYHNYPGHEQWSLFSLVRWSRIDTDTLPDFETNLVSHYKKSFEIFPFYFDYDSYNPDYDYFGIFPLWGELKNRLFYDRISWFAFPLYSKWEDNDERTYAFLWPIFRYREGPLSKGFTIWPLIGNFERENDYHERFALWPLLYYHQRQLYKDIPDTQIGILPLYARETREGYKREDYLWPFFGYTDIADPTYEEIRILWPIIIQGRGENRYINQVAPLYSLSERNGKKSTWFLWPLFNVKQYQSDGVDIRKFRLLYFLYQNTTQTVADETEEFIATKRHLWPFFSYWETREGMTQFQLLSPLEPLFQGNEEIRKTYSPIFSIYRYQEINRQNKDMDMLFSLIHFERRPDHERLEFGPIFGYEYGEKVKRIDILKGLIGYKKENDKKTLRLLWFKIPLGGKDEDKGTAKP
jgi:hypothetical protein